jgi:hypothetical protein
MHGRILIAINVARRTDVESEAQSMQRATALDECRNDRVATH